MSKKFSVSARLFKQLEIFKSKCENESSSRQRVSCKRLVHAENTVLVLISFWDFIRNWGTYGNEAKNGNKYLQ